MRRSLRKFGVFTFCIWLWIFSSKISLRNNTKVFGHNWPHWIHYWRKFQVVHDQRRDHVCQCPHRWPQLPPLSKPNNLILSILTGSTTSVNSSLYMTNDDHVCHYPHRCTVCWIEVKVAVLCALALKFTYNQSFE